MRIIRGLTGLHTVDYADGKCEGGLVMAMNKELFFSSNDNSWATPQSFYDKLNSNFNFTLDPCATPETAKCSKFYTKYDDGLTKDWQGETVFCNPPYGREIGKWVEKCYREALKPNTKAVMLIPARTDTKYFHDYILGNAEILFIKGRLKFVDSKGNCFSPAPFPSMVVVFTNKAQLQPDFISLIEPEKQTQ